MEEGEQEEEEAKARWRCKEGWLLWAWQKQREVAHWKTSPEAATGSQIRNRFVRRGRKFATSLFEFDAVALFP